MLTFPNAKINIGLNILRKRPDGFHDIASCFYPIALHDALEVIPSEKDRFSASGQSIVESEINLVSKARDLLARDFPVPPLSVCLLKGIPIGAGLGGGSSDAAFMIRLLNSMFGLQLSPEEQEQYARRLGSDCAFFIRNKPVYCLGKGDEFEDIGISLKGRFIYLVYPRIHISTAAAYAGAVPSDSGFDLREALKQPLPAWKDTVTNDFERVVFPKYPELSKIKETLYDAGALYASMSGSGSAVYGIFDNLQKIDNKFRDSFVWQGELS